MPRVALAPKSRATDPARANSIPAEEPGRGKDGEALPGRSPSQSGNRSPDRERRRKNPPSRESEKGNLRPFWNMMPKVDRHRDCSKAPNSAVSEAVGKNLEAAPARQPAHPARPLAKAAPQAAGCRCRQSGRRPGKARLQTSGLSPSLLNGMHLCQPFGQGQHASAAL